MKLALYHWYCSSDTVENALYIVLSSGFNPNGKITIVLSSGFTVNVVFFSFHLVYCAKPNLFSRPNGLNPNINIYVYASILTVRLLVMLNFRVEEESLRKSFRFATETTVKTRMCLYYMPRYMLVEPLNVKKPSSKTPRGDTRVSPSLRSWLGVKL